MDLAQIERIVCVSSEDPACPAVNLLRASPSDSSKRSWKCQKPGEKQISVVFQLAQCYRINCIEVQNDNSAFIEVLVGRSCSPNVFRTLLMPTSLMNLKDAKIGVNANDVRLFETEDFCGDVEAEKWDQVKVICRQPFNPAVCYGLCFVIFHVEQRERTDHVSVENEGRSLKNRLSFCKNDRESYSFSSRRNQSLALGGLSGAVDARMAANSLGNIKMPSASRFKAETMKAVLSRTSAAVNRNDQTLRNSPNSRGDLPSADSTYRNLASSPNEECSSRKPKKARASPNARRTNESQRKPFDRLLEGVVFVLSGYQNPCRSDLRRKAVEMGAKYKTEWDGSCTHLVCAFQTTPKYHEVQGRGKITTKRWIEECYSKRKCLPWRRFALAPLDRRKPESDEEIDEDVSSVLDHRRISNSSESASSDQRSVSSSTYRII